MDEEQQQCPISASVLPDDADAREAQRHIERIRVNELLRFFEPPPQDSELDTQPWKPRIATDTSLTAFAQLAALRLNCERCFISLIDDTKQYIIAEATQTVALASEDIYDGENDKLSFGQTILDFKTGVCPGTIACFTSLDSSLEMSTTYIQASRDYYVMNDMSQLDGYQNRSYVAGWPYMKYYAEVPVHSPAGHTIGTLCVVDNKPRDGLDLKGLSVLKEISNTVMNHLELCVSKIQRKRAERMIQALGQFVEGRDSVRELWIKEESSRLPEPGLQHLSLEQRALKEFRSTLLKRKQHYDMGTNLRQLNLDDPSQFLSADGEKERARLPFERTTSLSLNTNSSVLSTADSNAFSTPTTNGMSSGSALPTASTTTIIEQDEKSTEPWQDLDNLETILSRAANLLREAIDLDGVIFQDPSGTHVDHQNPLAKIISCSVKEDKEPILTDLPANALQTLTRQFANGGLLSFDGAGLIRAVPFDTQSLQLKFANRLENFAFGTILQDNVTDKVRAALNINDLRTIFPNVASLMIYPVWDTRRDKCVAYCIGWSSNPARVLQRQDVVYMASFSNSIIAQLARMETVAADQAKSIFMSSISHELRSPLHGILAGMENLRDLVSDDSHYDVLGLVESCGSALLDTIDNILEYSQTSQTSRNADQGDAKVQPHLLTSHERRPVAAVDLGKLVEDVTSVCLVGLHYSRVHDVNKVAVKAEGSGGQFSSHSPSARPIVICEVATGCALFETDSGAWKRILINLLTNALKYTESGYVLVKFEHHESLAESTQKSAATREVRLTVKDSGKGISQDYLTHHLYKPFRQENPLTPGTGLGLSIVSRLVSDIGGQINISSEVNVSTEVTVTAKLNLVASEIAEDPREGQKLEVDGLTLGFFDLNAVPDFDDPPAGILSSIREAVLLLRSTISQYASESGLKTVTAAAIDSAEVDILLIEDFRFRSLPISRFEELKKPIIVLCTSLLPDSDQAAFRADNVVLLSRPFGPRMFKRSLASCYKIQQDMKASVAIATISGPSDPPLDLLLPQENEVVAVQPVLIDISNIPAINNITQPTTSVLLVEDNPINMKLLVACAKKLKYDYLIATNGAEAVDAYVGYIGKIPLIFMDIQMPVMDGTEATRRIRQYERDNSLPQSRIVALTALGSNEAKQIALECGADLFLTKPVSLKTLTGLLVQHIEPYT